MVIEAHHESRALDDLASVLEPLQHGAINRNEQYEGLRHSERRELALRHRGENGRMRDGSIIRHEEGDLLVRETLT